MEAGKERNVHLSQLTMLPVLSMYSFTKCIYILLNRLISIKRETRFVVKTRLKTHATRTADNLQLEHFTRRRRFGVVSFPIAK